MLTILRRSALCATAALTVAATVNTADAASAALRGNVVVDGSSTVYPVTEAAAAAFRTSFPNVNVTVAVSGTGGGFKRFTKGKPTSQTLAVRSKPKNSKLLKKAALPSSNSQSLLTVCQLLSTKTTLGPRP